MKVSVPGMPVTLLNMSKNDIYKMVSGDKMDVKMNIFQRLWETLRHLFWSDKQTEAYKLLFNFVNNQTGNINASEYFTGAINENEREKFINSLELFNKLKTCAKNPDELVAKGNMRWVAQTFGDIRVSIWGIYAVLGKNHWRGRGLTDGRRLLGRSVRPVNWPYV